MKDLDKFARSPGVIIFLAVLFGVLIGGRGDDSSAGLVGGPSDTTPPIIMSTNPINGTTGVALINVIFSEPIDATHSNSASFPASGPGVTSVGGTVAYHVAQNRASFVPSSTLTLLLRANLALETCRTSKPRSAGLSESRSYIVI